MSDGYRRAPDLRRRFLGRWTWNYERAAARRVRHAFVSFPGDGPFYCSRDEGLYLDTGFIQDIREAAGDFPVAYVFAHEVAHHAQRWPQALGGLLNTTG